MRYFDHDTAASTDDKILSLRMSKGGAAVDAYWTILERIYATEKPLVLGENLPETKAVSHWLCLGSDRLLEFVKAMVSEGLLVEIPCEHVENDGSITVFSNRAKDKIAHVSKKAEISRDNGKKGGRPRNRKTHKNPAGSQREPSSNPPATQQQPSENHTKDYKTIREKDSTNVESKKNRAFAPPSRDEVSAYADAMGYEGFNADRFMAHYESNGWKVGKNPMRSWQSAVTSWHLRDRDYAKGGAQNVNLGCYASSPGDVF